MDPGTGVLLWWGCLLGRRRLNECLLYYRRIHWAVTDTGPPQSILQLSQKAHVSMEMSEE